MSDAYSTIFSDDPRTGALSYPQLEARRRIAIALATRNRPYPKTIGEGLTALGEGLGEGYMNRGLERAEMAQQGRDTSATRQLMGGAAPRVSEAPAEAAVETATADRQPLTPDQASQQPSMPVEEWLQRVARNESGGRKDAYTLVGERSRRGDYPYGKYQVMGENVPNWTQAYLGKKMTPDEFLANPDAQEQVARARGSEYIAKYGPDGAARAWFAGEKGMNDPNRKDTLGTHVAEYSRRFNIPLVSREQVVASAMRKPRPPEVLAESEFNRMDAAAPDASQAMAYAPEGAGEQGEPLVQQASLGGSAPPPGRDAIAAAVAQQQGVTPPQQVAAGPAPLPQAQPAQVAPIGEARPTPAGPKPELRTFIEGNPALRQQMDTAREIALNPRYSPPVQEAAKAKYKELEARANDAFTREWTIWHERIKKEEEFNLGAEGRQRTREKAPYELEHARKQAEPTTKEVEGRILERDPGTGKWNDVTPGGSLPNLTEVQAKTLGFYQRAKWALHNLGDGKELTDFAQWHASGMPVVGNYAVNAKFQRQLQAANELAAVQLRLETGANAPPLELKNVIDRFVPRPGDKPELHLQKEQERTTLLKSYADQMGSKGAGYIDKFNREFDLDKKEYDKKQNALLPPIKIDNPELVDMLPPGRRWIAPDGKIKQR